MFFVLIYSVLYISLSPSLSTMVKAAGMFFSETEKDYSTEYKNIFVPVSEEKESEPTVAIKDIEYPKYGQQFGELIIEDCSIDNKLFFGDGDIALRNGVGIYNGSFIPGYGGTILVAGHNNTYFNGLKNAEKGQTVEIKTSYGNYTYEITEVAVKLATDQTAYDLSADYENLIMYTCYPFDELGLTPKRCFVYAKYVSGPVIDKEDKGEE
ncbi:MAG: class D sortase [Acutalibacteraceae bacterium]|nr:class D sortase [Acutalibacteraceae bacterium]